MSQPSFEKGSIGQKCVERLFAGKRVFYWTDEEKAHPFDGMMLEWENYDIIAVEIKAKAARTHYRDTGFDIPQWERLKKARLKFNKDPFCVFVDEAPGYIYGNFLSVLERPRRFNLIVGVRPEYPSVEGKIVYFPLCSMNKLGDIPFINLVELRSLSQRNDAYEYPAIEHYRDLGKDAT